MNKPAKPAARKPAGSSRPARKAPAGATSESGADTPSGVSPKRVFRAPHIVGIGASAGGLEALEQFFAHVPAGSGMAFVVIQHLDPTHKGMMPELLQRFTSMTVCEADSRMQVRPDCVYVIPPNRDLSILHGVLHLLDPVAPRGLRLPVDFFFRALAQDQGERAIGVILSGMGSDGTLGLRAIKEHAGLVLVQAPASAKYDSMPRSAIDAGLADIIATGEELPGKILDFLKNIPKIASAEPALAAREQGALEKIVVLLREHTGNDFSLYKKNTLYRRIERRMGLHQIDNIATYVRYLRENPQELDLLFKELLIGVTSFFRDPEVWEYLRDKAIPDLLAQHPAGRMLRAWVPACSTGEEAYSLAIVFREALEKIRPQASYSLQIFATDLDPDAIEKARLAVYPTNIAADVSAQRLKQYFSEDEPGFLLNKDIREMVIFAPQNIIMDPPFTRLDMLTCRNLLIYLGPELQKRLIPLFSYSMNRHGLLLLGNSETIGGFNSLFTPLESKMRIYQRNDHQLSIGEVDFPTRHFSATTTPAELPRETAPPVNLQGLVDQLLLQHFSPAAVLVNTEGDILYISGRTGKYLEPAAGKANWNIHVMAREGLRAELARALRQSLRQPEPVSVEGLKAERSSGAQTVSLTVQAISSPEALHGRVLVVFTDVATLPEGRKSTGRAATSAAHRKLLEELQQAREEVQTLREEMQTSQEELTSTNEELQSTNEELQSTNEELTTSKEEMQSLNEELQTVNAELQSKLEDLSSINNDMKNLLNSIEIATVFLDNQMHVRRFTSHATQLFKLIAGDVGRPLSDIVTSLDYPELRQDAEEVLQTLVFSEKQVVTRSGRWFRVRIMPYRTQDNVIDGVVITFLDITEYKNLENELLQGRSPAAP
ncbi:MAG: PAS domain-containing protein [Gammaproteobacteria bacterium]|nr:PAS domain-containing protein [Gammaproteobacteria bacterium]MBU1732112.1 PAS domain-containing protein [Gammaproteobacteria bacterium]MBU1893358.1 PAS domain-containing protein [Gammaproteobacteria bacterium]